MDNWKFLVQQDGDRSWMTLKGERPTLNFGRYRIAARSPYANTAITIEITVQLPSGDQRYYRRNTRTNEDGLLAVVPFTEFMAGEWTLTCHVAAGFERPASQTSIGWQVANPIAASDAPPTTTPTPTLDPTTQPQPAVTPSSIFTAQSPEITPEIAPETSPAVPTVASLLEVNALLGLAQSGITDPVAALAQSAQEPSIAPTDPSDTANLDAVNCADRDSDPLPSHPDPSAATDSTATIIEFPRAVQGETDIPPSLELKADAAAFLPKFAGEVVQTAVSPIALLTDDAASAMIVNPLIEPQVEPQAEPQVEPQAEPQTEPRTEPQALGASAEQVPPTPPPICITSYTPNSLSLVLEQTSFVSDAGDTLTLSGTITPQLDLEPGTRLSGLHLRVRLREPQSLKIVMTQRFLLKPEAGVIQFSRSFSLPSQGLAKLMLGEVLLCDVVPQTIAKQSFTITASLQSLLNALPLESEEVTSGDLWQDAIAPTATTRSRRLPNSSSPISSKTPQLRQSPLGRSGNVSNAPMVDLPSFVRSESGVSAGVDRAALLASLGFAPSDQGSDQGLDEESGQGADQGAGLLNTVNPGEGQGDRGLSGLEAGLERAGEGANPAGAGSGLSSAPVSGAGGDRFVSRLNQIVSRQDPQDLAGWVTPQETAIGWSEGSEQSERSEVANPYNLDVYPDDLAALTPASHVLATEPSTAKDPIHNHEIVLDVSDATYSSQAFARDLSLRHQPTLPPEVPIPCPVLSVPPGQLTAGRLILVRARLPMLVSRVYVKLWIYDRQNQALLDGPRWMTDFLPLDEREVEGMMSLTVPYGGLDVQFEAIAVEVETGRESYKAIVDRQVVPVAAPRLPLEKL